MEHTPQLYDTLVHVLSQHVTWLDQRHLKTLAWMMVGLIQSGWISLTAWAPYVVSRAQYAQSTVRRFRRWLNNDKLDVLSLYGPLMTQALAEWGEQALYVALDTSMLWDTYCLIRLSVIYRGRAVPPGVVRAPTRQCAGGVWSLPRPPGSGGVAASTVL